MKKSLIIGLIIIALAFFSCNTYEVQAKTLRDLKQDLADMKAKYTDNESQKEMTEAEIAAVEKEIESINDEIDKINEDIEALNNDIEERNKEIDKMNEEIKSIMRYYQLTNNDLFYLQYIFEAKDYTDFIYRLAITEQLSEYRKKMVDEYNRLIEENKKKIEEMAAKKVD